MLKFAIYFVFDFAGENENDWMHPNCIWRSLNVDHTFPELHEDSVTA